ncbi:nucleoside triphosphate pyrophosphohydrolase [Mycolicibacterium sp.]|uniref:nucleoside triphosphate pyrophosphohydrolase n=1 Tax=Mycolicibacterium sp. TaxID=2320850 RepID=UPI00355ED600
MAKLVRDNIPGLIRASGRRAVTRQLDDDEFAAALLDKLAEETAEVRSAATAEAVLEEAADEKRLKRGGFATRCWLEDQCLGY